MGQHPSKNKDVTFVRAMSDRNKERFAHCTKKGSLKKRNNTLKANHVLNGTQKVTPKTERNEAITARNNSKNLALSNKDVINSINVASRMEKKKENKVFAENGRAAVKGGRTSPGTRPTLTSSVQRLVGAPLPSANKVQQVSKTAEALAVLVHHLVYNLEAFKNPGLRKQAEKAKLEAEEARMSCTLLEESLCEEKQRHMLIVQDERIQFRAEIARLIENHRDEMFKLNLKHKEAERFLGSQKDTVKDDLLKIHEDQLHKVQVEIDSLRQTHEEMLDILRQENDAIREECDEKVAKVRKDNDAKDMKIRELQEEVERCKESYTPSSRSDGDTSLQEVQSLRVVLELKQSEIAELRKALVEATHKADRLPAAEERVALLTAKCEDLHQQLARRVESEMGLYAENKKLNDSMTEEVNEKKRLNRHIEELQWKLQHNKEVFKVLESSDQHFTRSMVSSSFNERHTSTPKHSAFERTLSMRERKISTNSSRKSRSSIEADLDDISPPSSPKVKSVVEKQASVSYVLEMDESPDVIASRILRRSFRNGTPKSTPTKTANRSSPRNYALMQSASASCVGKEQPGADFEEWRAATTGNNFSDCTYAYELFKLPILPSEIGRKPEDTLPEPKHLAGEAISESNSEDECSSSSSGQL